MIELLILFGVWANVCIQGYWLSWDKQLHRDTKHDVPIDTLKTGKFRKETNDRKE